MNIDEKQIASIVEEVLSKIDVSEKSGPSDFTGVKVADASLGLGIFSNIDEAIDAALNAFKEFRQISLEKRKEIIEAMRQICRENNDMLAKMAVEETGLGSVEGEGKIAKNLLTIDKTPGPEDLDSFVYSGDRGLTLIERAPYGVIGAITPSTNPVATIINNSISMLSAGNTVVFNPHPSAKKVSAKTVQLLNQAIVKAGGPENLLTCPAEPTIETSQQIMNHKKISLLVVTGGPAVVKLAMNSGKKVIAAGPGNPPVVVDETADIAKAASDIVKGASFDNNIVCILEKEVFVVEKVADSLIYHMKLAGAYELTPFQTNELTKMIITDPGGPAGGSGKHPVVNKNYVGKDVSIIAGTIGLKVPPETKLLICQTQKDHPLVLAEQLMPVLPIVRVKDVKTAIDWAIEAEHGFKHTAIMHSKNIENLSLMAQKVDCSIFIKNAPSLAGLGFGGEGFTSMTIASPTGEGVTSARTFTRLRRCVLVDYFRII